ncbi:MAG: porin [Holosporaceae bacterium]|jgi:outer membrane protein OmpU|nr:porin [Rhodospirillaceae bacterium]
MKKVLLVTTALLGLVALNAPANADPLKVTVGGSVEFQAGFADEDFDSNYRNYDFTSTPNVVVGAEGKASNGLVYGGKIEVDNESSFNATTGARTDSIKFDKAVTYLSGKWGRVELGDENSASNRLTVTAPTGFGTGGFAGDYQKFLLINSVGDTGSLSTPSNNFNLNRSAEGFYFRGLANSYKPTLTESGLEDYEDSTKVTYLTPKFSGFQLGLSYTPKVGSALTGVSRDKYTSYSGGTPALWNQYEDLIEAAANYSYKFDNGLGLGASLGYNYAKAVKTTTANVDRENLGSLNVGLNGTFKGFTLGGGYTYDGESGLRKATQTFNDAGQSYNVGLQYATGPFAVGVNYLNAENEGDVTDRDNNKLQVVGLGGTYELAPGLSTFAEVDFVNYESEDAFLSTNTSRKYDSTVFVLGTKLDF